MRARLFAVVLVSAVLSSLLTMKLHTPATDRLFSKQTLASESAFCPPSGGYGQFGTGDGRPDQIRAFSFPVAKVTIWDTEVSIRAGMLISCGERSPSVAGGFVTASFGFEPSR